MDSVRVAEAILRKVAAMCCARAGGAGSELVEKKRLGAKGRDDSVFVLLSQSVTTSVAEPGFGYRLFFGRPEPAACV